MAFAYTAPYFLMNTASVDDINRKIAVHRKESIELCPLQYRPNLVIEHDEPYAEVIVFGTF